MGGYPTMWACPFTFIRPVRTLLKTMMLLVSRWEKVRGERAFLIMSNFDRGMARRAKALRSCPKDVVV